ncbi:MAG TPA: hypothetical protein QF509_07940 [Rhodospirillales bacterium]|nr:hypothetical protein [Rhodospirillales bacterium]
MPDSKVKLATVKDYHRIFALILVMATVAVDIGKVPTSAHKDLIN